MSREHVGHADIATFAEERVNLRKADAVDLRAQANRLRDRLTNYVSEHPDFALRKLILSGSLAKGTALKSTSDIDLACYVSAATAPGQIADLVAWLATRLETAFANLKPEQIQRKTYSVSITFAGTGNEIDIVPILYAGDPDWRGDLISQDDGSRLMTSVPLHLEFIRKRKTANPKHFAQVVRLVKYWAGRLKAEDPEFRFKSFMVELILAKLADEGLPLNDYPEALSGFFAYLATDALTSKIAFDDYYDPSRCAATADPVCIWDPVNCENNVSRLYGETNRAVIVEAALDAGDAIDAALYATTKAETVRYWQKVLGPSFNP